VDADPRHIRLLMFQAEAQAQRIKVTQAVPITQLVLAVLVICGVMGLFAYRKYQSVIRYEQAVQASASVVHKPARATPHASTRDITTALAVVRGAITDVNGDGKVNCIDAAVLFYRAFPYHDDVRIVQNTNSNTGMNHLFNYVRINGEWQAVEPQSLIQGYGTWDMHNVWGGRYDARYDMDATMEYMKYVTG
jgi:hypothetical protein